VVDDEADHDFNNGRDPGAYTSRHASSGFERQAELIAEGRDGRSVRSRAMILHDAEIRSRLKDLFPEHYEVLLAEDRVQPASLDLTVSGPLMRVGAPGLGDEPIRPGTDEPREVPYTGDRRWVLRPGILYLLSTREKVAVPANLVGRLDGRSSWARVGLRVHATAGFLDPGFIGRITLELDVVGSPIELREGDSICQVSFHVLTGKAEFPYGTKGSKYQNQDGVTASRSLDSGNSR